jgi:hypothetical protein
VKGGKSWRGEINEIYVDLPSNSKGRGGGDAGVSVGWHEGGCVILEGVDAVLRWVYGELLYLECRHGLCSYPRRMRSVALGEWGKLSGRQRRHVPACAFVLVFQVRDICAVPCVWDVAAARGESAVFRAQRVIDVGVVRFIKGVGIEFGSLSV